ncbi:unnamed protein product [Lactuca saligna]|uniref:Uncharacterized protein n=1 Tax=Lactuca saligna TaxID=75948 RepID=A0AA35VYP8_LACSI|nr:unnamed protein product [Lactuca saligna]
MRVEEQNLFESRIIFKNTLRSMQSTLLLKWTKGGSQVRFTHTNRVANLPTLPPTITASSSLVMSQVQAQFMASRATNIEANDDGLDFRFSHPFINRRSPVNAYIITHKQLYPSK